MHKIYALSKQRLPFRALQLGSQNLLQKLDFLISKNHGMDSSQSEPDDEYSDDSSDDPTFNVSSNNSVKRRKISSRIFKGQDGNEGASSDDVAIYEPELDEQDPRSYETIRKTIEDGQVERLKMDECKVYLRNHGLRLSGSKETLVLRIKEHIDLINVGGEKLYPASSFVLNCRGDACVGDTVMFQQEVYEAFDVVSHSSIGPQGTRVVAGRIVKESYGAAKQQHTFTIEVLWSKGKKPLPPLQPLLIKGRNLYKKKTVRQKWEDEGQRLEILSEKHSRGDVARLQREERIKERELRNIHKHSRSTRSEHTNKKQDRKRVPLKPERLIKQQPELKHRHPANTLAEQSYKQHLRPDMRTFEASIPIQRRNLPGTSYSIPNAQMLDVGVYHRQPLISMNFGNYLANPYQVNYPKGNWSCSRRSPSHGSCRASYSQQAYTGQNLYTAHNHPPFEEKQLCRYYVQGRCTYGERCKYLHE